MKAHPKSYTTAEVRAEKAERERDDARATIAELATALSEVGKIDATRLAYPVGGRLAIGPSQREWARLVSIAKAALEKAKGIEYGITATPIIGGGTK